MKRLLLLLIGVLFLLLSPNVSYSQCIADFSFSNTTCTNGAITFWDLSSATGSTIVKQTWDFGDGGTDTLNYSYQGGITHNYFDNGTFTVTHTIFTNTGCTTSVSKDLHISIKPQVAFNLGGTARMCGYNAQILSNISMISTRDSLFLLWSFSDDSLISSSNVVYKKYSTPGIHSIKLNVTAENGCKDSLTKSIYISEIVGASMKIKNKNICLSDTAVINLSILGDSYNSNFIRKTLNFGDGNSLTETSMAQTVYTHKYLSPGIYKVILTYETTTCVLYYIDSIEIRPVPQPAFSTTPETSNLCSGSQKINFSNLSTSPQTNPLKYEWNINNSLISTLTNPSITYYQNGNFPITLKAIDSTDGCFGILNTSINVSGVNPKPKTNFAFETDNNDLLRIKFYDSSTVNAPEVIENYTWDFGDGSPIVTTTAKDTAHTYPLKGIYIVKHISNTLSGCSDTLTKTINVDSLPISLCNPLFLVPSFVCLGNNVSISDSSYLKAGADSLIQQIWNFGDGTKDTIYSNFYYSHPHLYTSPGIYTISLTIFTKRGCTSTLSKIITVRSSAANADISFTQNPNCTTTNQSVQLNVNYENTVGNFTYKWIYGDGYTSSTYNTSTDLPNQLYSYAPGTYIVKFLTRMSSCQSTYDTISKTIIVLNKSKSDFVYNIDELNSKKVQFLDKSYNGFNIIQEHIWDFGDGTISKERDPLHIYNSYGTFTVKHSFISDACIADTMMYAIKIDSMNLLPLNITQSNMGTEFWAGYGYIENMKRAATNASRPHLSIYLAASENPATVLVDIPNMPLSKKTTSGFPKVVYVPANTVVEVKDFPIGDPNDIYNAKNLADTRLYFTGITDRAIRIISNQPIGAWEHIYSDNNTAGGTLLLPTKMWSTSYFVQSRGGNSNTTNPNSFFFVIAESDSTIIEFTPSTDIIDSSAATIFTQSHTVANVKYNAGIKYSIKLNKGEVFNAMGFINTSRIASDLSGTKIISTNPFKRIAVFGGNGRVIINTAGCTNTTGSDNLIQQMFPKAVWGTQYLTAPTKTMENGVYRITVDDPTTIVSVNGTPLSPFSIINNRYYEITRNQPLKIESDKRVMVTQYVVTPGCPSATTGNNGTGDPELINLTPLKYGIKNVSIYSPTFKTVSVGASASYLNIIIRKEGLNSLLIDNSNMVDTGTSSFIAGAAYGSSPLVSILDGFKSHPGDANYAYAKIKVATGSTHTISSDSSFLAIAYGMTNGETIGYNAGFNFNSIPVQYQFLGNGDWTNPINWLGNKIPPSTLPMGSEIIITGTCTLNTPQTIEDGARLVVEEGGNLIINGNLKISL